MAEQAEDRALVLCEVFCNITGGVSWRIDFSNINNRRAGVDLPPIFQKRMGDVRTATRDMDVRPATLRQFPDQDVLEILKVFSDFLQKTNPASLHQGDGLRRRVGSGWVRGERYHAFGVPATYLFLKAKRLWDFTGRAPP